MHKAFSAPVAVLLAMLVFAGCDKHTPTPYPVFQDAVYVVCEGQFGVGNAALTKYSPDSGTVIPDAYYAAAGAHLGDIFQSMARINDAYFFCINNSDRIIVASPYNLHDIIATLSVPKPRYVLQVSAEKAYVSTLYSNKLYKLNVFGGVSVGEAITLPHANPEGMLLIANTAYICTWDTAASAIYTVDIFKDSVTGSIPIPGRAPQEIVQDADGMIWVLSGNKAAGAEAMLTRLNPATGAVLQYFSFGNADPLRLITSPSKDTLYFIELSYTGGSDHNGVYRMGIHDAALPAQAFVAASGQQYFWGIGIHPKTGYLYVADPKGFTQSGQVRIYRQDGTSVSSFPTGVGPGHFYFE